MEKKNIIKKFVLAILFFFIMLTISNKVQAAGVDGTTIVLNPRAWWKLDRLCK